MTRGGVVARRLIRGIGVHEILVFRTARQLDRGISLARHVVLGSCLASRSRRFLLRSIAQLFVDLEFGSLFVRFEFEWCESQEPSENVGLLAESHDLGTVHFKLLRVAESSESPGVNNRGIREG